MVKIYSDAINPLKTARFVHLLKNMFSVTEKFRSLSLIFFLSVFSISTINAQTVVEVFSKIEQSISKADAQQLSGYFNGHLEITIGDKDDTYPKNQALYVVREFFMNYPVRSFKIVHKGSSGDTHYAIGQYNSTRGVFDTNIFIKKAGNTFLIEQLRFEQGK